MCAFGMEVYGTRMYESFNTIWRGWRRIYLHAYEQNPWPLLKNTASVFFFSVLPVFLQPLEGEDAFSALLCLAILGIMFATAWKAYAIVKARKRVALLHPLAALVFTAILLDALQMALFKRKTHWRQQGDMHLFREKEACPPFFSK